MSRNISKRLYVHETIDDISNYTKRLKVNDNVVQRNITTINTNTIMVKLSSDISNLIKNNNTIFDKIQDNLNHINSKINKLDSQIQSLKDTISNNKCNSDNSYFYIS